MAKVPMKKMKSGGFPAVVGKVKAMPKTLDKKAGGFKPGKPKSGKGY